MAKPVHRRQPRQDRARGTRELILDTAAELFGTLGVAKTSTNRIAADAEVSIGTVYRYFADRDAIVAELLDRLLDDVERVFRAHLPDLSALDADDHRDLADRLTDRVARALAAFTDVLVENAPLLRAFVSAVQYYSSTLPEFEHRLRALAATALRDWLGPRDDAQLERVTFVFVNTTFAVVVRAAASSLTDEDRAAALAMASRMMGAWLADEAGARSASRR
ncbi:TetR/AcrR family transcriptional regulator [Nocardia thailandica]